MENKTDLPQEVFRVAELILLHREHRLGREDAAVLQSWLESSAHNQQLLEEWTNDLAIQEHINTFHSITDVETAFETKFAPRLAPLREEGGIIRPIWGRRVFRAAAVLLIPTLLAGFWYFRSHHGEPASLTARTSASVPTNDAVRAGKGGILPGSERATLTLSDGSRMFLDKASVGPLTRQGGVMIDKKEDGRLAYEPTGAAAGETAYNTLTTPRGGTYKVGLPDGTVVWLNAGSQLRYPVPFHGNQREVSLSGEAYFEVAPHPEAPFLVHLDSKNTDIRVLGTHFDVSAYEEESICMTTVLEGSVKVAAGQLGSAAPFSTAVLHANDQAKTNAQGGIDVTNNPHAADAAAWTSGRIALGGRDIQAIMQSIARWYDVSVVYQGDINHPAFVGSISRAASLDNALNILSATNSIHFTVDKANRRIIVTP